MAQKVTGIIKLQIPAGKATPAPPVGPALGQHGVNIAAFTKEFNERTKNDAGMIIPVVITVYADRSFTFITKTPPACLLYTSHFDQDISGKNLALHFLGTIIRNFCNCLHRNADLLNEIMEVPVFDILLNGGLYGVFIAGVGVDNIPLCALRHRTP